MKLTTKQLRQIIKEELKLVNESLYREVPDDADGIMKLLDGMEVSDIMYYDAQSLNQMIAILNAEIKDQKSEYRRLDNDYNQRWNKIDPNWWDLHVFPIEQDIKALEQTIELLWEALNESGVTLPGQVEPLTDDEINYKWDMVIDSLLDYVLDRKEVWDEDELRKAVIEHLKKSFEWNPEVLERGVAFADYIVDQYNEEQQA